MNYSMTAAVYAVLIAFVLGMIICPAFIPYLHRLKFGQQVREEGVQSHLKKAGTPTMGGIVIVVSIVAASLFFIKGNGEGVIALFMCVGFGIIGFIDDYIKVVKKRSMGLRAWQKMLGEIVVFAGFIALLNYYNIDTTVYIPFSKGIFVDFKWFTPVFLAVVVLGAVNGANFTDGLDGLASGVTLLIVVFFIFVAHNCESGLVTVLGAAGGALLAFLFFNFHPAKVFMGDTGSLALGGLIAAAAVILKMEFVLVIVAFIYVAEVASVMLQVTYFKLTKGKRLFKMAPIHHHFEMMGWPETRVVAMFYIATTIFCLIGFLSTNGMFS